MIVQELRSESTCNRGVDYLQLHRYIPTEDIKPLVVARRETSEAEEVKFMREQFNTSGVVTGEIS
jgi:hypothetical protein